MPYEVRVQTEKGLGYAVICGIKQAKGNVICVMDSDGSHNPTSLPNMLKLIGKYDIVIGSRYCGGKTNDTFIRELISRVFCLFAQGLFGLTVKDNMSGYVMAKKEVFEAYPIGNKGYKFGLETLYRSRNKYKAVEYPIVFEQRKMGKSKASPMEAFNTLLFMFKLKVKLKY